MFSCETIKELKQVIADKDEQICKLNKKLEHFDAVVNERNDLREIYKEFEWYSEQNKNEGRILFNELLKKYEIQTETLKKVLNAEYQCELRKEKLEDENNCMNHQLKILKHNENKLQSELADSKKNLEFVQEELSTIKLELEKQNSIVKKLETNFKCKEQELFKVSRELDECKTKYNTLNETNEILVTNLKDTKKILCDTKLSAKHKEEAFEFVRKNLTNELEISCEKINDLEMRYDELKRELDGERCTIKSFYKKMKESNKVNAKTHLETKNLFQKLHDNLCALKEKVNELEQENDLKCVEINTLKNKLNEREFQLQQMYLLSERIEQIKKKIEACTKNNTETNTCCPKEKSNVNICCSHCRQDSTTDMCCGTSSTSNNEKAVIQKDAIKLIASKKNIHKTLLKNMICELRNLLHNVF